MFGLTYLSTEYRRALESLQDKLTRTFDRAQRREIALATQDLLSREKPYIECDLIEADDLRGQLLNKINILNRLGKNSESFRMHLKDVEFHIQTIQMKDTLKEASRIKSEEAPNLKDKRPTVRSMRSERRRKTAFGQHRWQIGFEDDIIDEQK